MDRRIYTHLTTVTGLGLFFLPLHPLLSGPLILAVVLFLPPKSIRHQLGLCRPTAIGWLLIPVLVAMTVGLGLLVPVRSQLPVPAGWTVYLTAVLAVLITAASEEMLFRSLLLSAYSTDFGAVPVVMVSSILFAAGHLYQGLPAAGFALAAGLLYSLVFLKQRNYWILAAAHGIHNLLALPLPDIR